MLLRLASMDRRESVSRYQQLHMLQVVEHTHLHVEFDAMATTLVPRDSSATRWLLYFMAECKILEIGSTGFWKASFIDVFATFGTCYGTLAGVNKDHRMSLSIALPPHHNQR